MEQFRVHRETTVFLGKEKKFFYIETWVDDKEILRYEDKVFVSEEQAYERLFKLQDDFEFMEYFPFRMTMGFYYKQCVVHNYCDEMDKVLASLEVKKDEEEGRYIIKIPPILVKYDKFYHEIPPEDILKKFIHNNMGEYLLKYEEWKTREEANRKLRTIQHNFQKNWKVWEDIQKYEGIDFISPITFKYLDKEGNQVPVMIENG